MRTRHEVMRDFGFPQFTEKAIDKAIYAMADRICELEQERDEDQGVIAVWRGRTERAETRAERMTSVFLAAKEWYDIQDAIASGFAEMKDFNRCESELVKAMEDYYATEKRET